MAEVAANSLVRFDRRFAIMAIVIGLSYALIISALGLILGTDAAGVAGVALTALATAVFRRFEDLQFKKAPTTTIEVPTVGIWLPFLLILSFVGAEVIFGFLAGFAINAMGFAPDAASDLTKFVEFLLNPSILITMFGAKALAYITTAYCAARVIECWRYSQILVAGFLALILSTLLPIASIAQADPEAASGLLTDPATYVFGVFWIVFLGAALLGTKLAAKRSLVKGQG